MDAIDITPGLGLREANQGSGTNSAPRTATSCRRRRPIINVHSNFCQTLHVGPRWDHRCSNMQQNIQQVFSSTYWIHVAEFAVLQHDCEQLNGRNSKGRRRNSMEPEVFGAGQHYLRCPSTAGLASRKDGLKVYWQCYV